MIVLHGHDRASTSTDPQRGAGVDLKLEPMPTKSVWMIESALAAENKVRAQTGSEASHARPPRGAPTLADGEEVAAAEVELIRALEAEAESLQEAQPVPRARRRLRGDRRRRARRVRRADQALSPGSLRALPVVELRQVAAEIFILIRDAYRRLADDKGRQQVIATLGQGPAARAPSRRRAACPRSDAPRSAAPVSAAPSRVAVPARPPSRRRSSDARTTRRRTRARSPPSSRIPSSRRADQLAIPVDRRAAATARLVRRRGAADGHAVGRSTDKPPARHAAPVAAAGRRAGRHVGARALLDEGKVDEALARYRMLAKKHPQDRVVRAGIELCEGLQGARAARPPRGRAALRGRARARSVERARRARARRDAAAGDERAQGPAVAPHGQEGDAAMSRASSASISEPRTRASRCSTRRASRRRSSPPTASARRRRGSRGRPTARSPSARARAGRR